MPNPDQLAIVLTIVAGSLFIGFVVGFMSRKP